MSTMTEHRRARLALAAAVEPASRPHLAAAVRELGAASVVAALLTGRPRLDARVDPDGSVAHRLRQVDPAAVQAATRAAGLSFVVPDDPEWPSGLDDLAEVVRDRRGEVPFGLWTAGPLRLDALATGVAMVGSRAATPYGMSVATDWAAELGESGVLVVSGAAYGIDAAAHRGALAVGSPTVAVLAGGVDQAYPRGNSALIDRIAATGLLVSEAPPGSAVNRGRFLGRNRLIAAITRGVVVVEAGVRSGALSTAGWAVALNRPIGAVPGPVTSAMSLGPHRLVVEGSASLEASPGQVRELMGRYGADLAPVQPVPAGPLDDLPEPLLRVRESMRARTATSVAELVAGTGLPVPAVLRALDELAQRELVVGAGDSWRLRPPRRGGT
jgi:DNA processing protein